MPLGAWDRSAAGRFSFYPGKNLGGCGEGGAVVTNDAALAARMRRLRDHAQAQRHHHVELGYNMRMDGFQGAVLGVKLPLLDGWNAVRSRNAARYGGLLAGAHGITLPALGGDVRHVWHLYVVLLAPGTRDAVRKRLAEQGIATGIHYPVPIHLQPAYAFLGYRLGDFPVAEDVASRCPVAAALSGTERRAGGVHGPRAARSRCRGPSPGETSGCGVQRDVANTRPCA